MVAEGSAIYSRGGRVRYRTMRPKWGATVKRVAVSKDGKLNVQWNSPPGNRKGLERSTPGP
jgi:hypothetical protein